MWLVLLGQFPLYGLLIDFGKKQSKESLSSFLIVLIHCALVLAVMIPNDFYM